MLGFRKNAVIDPIRSAFYGAPPQLTNAIFIFGRVGSGKTTSMLTLAQKYHDHPDRRYKIIDLWGGERSEGLFWTMPSKNHKYWSIIKKKFRLENDGPKQYKVTLLYPMTRDLPKKLPYFPGTVNSKIFTIPIKSVTPEDISLALGELSVDNKTLWRETIEQVKKKDNGVVVEDIMSATGSTNRAVFKSFVVPLVREGLLQSEINENNIDLIDEMKDKETITVLILDFVDKQYRLFVLGYIIRQINELIDKGKISTHTIGMIREASEFFRATDQSVVSDEKKIFRMFLAQAIKMGRRGFHLFLDAQSPAETKNIADGNQDLTLLGKLPSENDRIVATTQLYRDNLITKKQITDISVLNPGEYYICEVGKKAKKRYFFLPRTDFWTPGAGNFYENIWKKQIDQWIGTQEIKLKIDEDIKNTRKAIAEKKKLDAQLAKLEKAKNKKDTDKDDDDDNIEDTIDISENEDLDTVTELEEQKEETNVYIPEIINTNVPIKQIQRVTNKKKQKTKKKVIKTQSTNNNLSTVTIDKTKLQEEWEKDIQLW